MRTQKKRVEPDRHVRVKSGLASARYPVVLLESFLKVVREDLRGNEELSDVAAFSAGSSPHEDCLAEDAYVDDVRGGVLLSQASTVSRPSCGHGCRRSQSSVLERWIDTDKGDADRPNCRSGLVVRGIKKAMKKKSDVPSAAELFSGMPPLETVKAPFSLFVSHSHQEEKGKRTLAMYDISRAHVHGVPVRRVPVELRTRRKRGSHVRTDLIWNTLACMGKCMYGTVDSSALGQAHHAQIWKEHELVQGLSAIPLCLCTWRMHFDCSCTVLTSPWRCPLMKRNGSKYLVLETRWT